MPEESLDQHLTRRLREGERDAEALTEELLGFPALIRPAVLAYVRNRINGYVRAEHDLAGRDPGRQVRQDDGNTQPHIGPEPMTPQQARQAVLQETVTYPSLGLIAYPIEDLTLEQVDGIIKHLYDSRAGIDKSISYWQARRSDMERLHAGRLGDVPVEDWSPSRAPDS
jgi:hypothetical protein